MKIKTRKSNSFLKEVLFEIVGEVVWNILLFIPRMAFRLITSIW